jgi:hypothetical protein
MSSGIATRRTWLLVLLLALIVALAAPPAPAGTISLAWNPVAEATGYRVHYGTSPGQYDRVLDVGNSTAATVGGLADCTQYHLAVMAYAGDKESDGFSAEIQGMARPEIRSFDPRVVRQGDQLAVELDGANFASGASLTWNAEEMPLSADGEPLLRLDEVRVASCTTIAALLAVEPLARGFRAMQIGARGLQFELVNPDRTFVSASPVLDVTFAPLRADINRSDSMTRDRVDGKDLSWLAFAYGSLDGEPRFNPDADLSGDGLVDGEDLALLSPVFGQCWNGQGWSTAACQ